MKLIPESVSKPILRKEEYHKAGKNKFEWHFCRQETQKKAQHCISCRSCDEIIKAYKNFVENTKKISQDS
jgi:formylmethanofuran dehydrogenase subunit E